jgi:hypothetical protein
MEAPFPASLGAAGLVFFLGGNGIAMAHWLFWRRSQRLFWLSSTFIVFAMAGLVLTGTGEAIARSLWPAHFDSSDRGRELRRRVDCFGRKVFSDEKLPDRCKPTQQ